MRHSLVRTLAEILGAKPAFLPVSSEILAAKGLQPIDISPFNTPWMSHLDPTLGYSTLNLTHESLRPYLEKIVASFVAHPPADRPANYANRPVEIELAGGKK